VNKTYGEKWEKASYERGNVGLYKEEKTGIFLLVDFFLKTKICQAGVEDFVTQG
jgi:hypothetical protein